MLGLARGLLDGSVDRIDGLFALGRSVNYHDELDNVDYTGIIGPWDDLDAVPRQAQRSVWNEEAYQRERAHGVEIIGWYGPKVDLSIRRLIARLEFGS